MSSLDSYIRTAFNKGYSRKEIISLLSEKGYSSKEINTAFDNLKIEPQIKTIQESDINYLESVRLLFVQPKQFFSSVRPQNIGKSTVFLLVTCLVVAIVGSMIASAIGGFFGGFGSGRPYMIFLWIIIAGIGFATTFAYAGVVHLIAKWVDGKGKYTDTYNACAYSLLPALILSIIPFVGWLAFIYSIVLCIIGLSIYHKFSTGKAIIAVLAPLAIVVIVFIFFIVYLIFALRAVF